MRAHNPPPPLHASTATGTSATVHLLHENFIEYCTQCCLCCLRSLPCELQSQGRFAIFQNKGRGGVLVHTHKFIYFLNMLRLHFFLFTFTHFFLYVLLPPPNNRQNFAEYL
ncbi:unnamed protein product [Amoebophrya sp. A120]|nr:unnamed protein product [Amoebophrya sp. A120]|eukprot:GSA120T00014497001.1